MFNCCFHFIIIPLKFQTPSPCKHDFTSLFLHFLPQCYSCCCNACTLVLIPTCSCEGFLCYNVQFLSIYSSDMPKIVTKKWNIINTNWERYLHLSYRQKCVTVKYTTHEIHTKLQPGPELHIFLILIYLWLRFPLFNDCLLKQPVRITNKKITR